MPMPRVDFWANVQNASLVDCWVWKGRLDDSGYGRVGKRSLPAHRVSYEELVGPIPEGVELDHLCHTRDLSCVGGVTCPHRRCVNPAHLEVVTHKENAYRGRSFAAANAQKTHCPQGHPYDDANTYRWPGAKGNSRACRACRNKRRVAA